MTQAKDIAALIRVDLKAAAIKAKVRVTPGQRKDSVQINPPQYGVEFTDAEQDHFRKLGKSLGLTRVYARPIEDHSCDAFGIELYL